MEEGLKPDTYYFRNRHRQALAGDFRFVPEKPNEQMSLAQFDGKQRRLTDYEPGR